MNYCLNCGQETNNSKFCSRKCSSIKHWEEGVYTAERNAKISKSLKNKPLSETHKKNLGLSRIEYYKNNPDEKEIAYKNMMSGHTEETGRKISLKLRGRECTWKDKDREGVINAILSGKHTPKGGKRGRRDDLNKFFRSSWEANTARIFNYLGLQWVYESKECRFKLDNGKIIIFDFYLPILDLYIEVKGYFGENTFLKINKFKELYPEKHLLIIDSKKYKDLVILFGDLIPCWETTDKRFSYDYLVGAKT